MEETNPITFPFPPAQNYCDGVIPIHGLQGPRVSSSQVSHLINDTKVDKHTFKITWTLILQKTSYLGPQSCNMTCGAYTKAKIGNTTVACHRDGNF